MTYQIDAVDARIVDLPIRCEHAIGVTTMSRQSSVIVQVRTKEGLTGVGEGVVPGGGPEWGGESVESIKVTIDRYLAPAVTNVPLRGINDALHRMGKASAGNHFAKAAIDMALWDILGKRASPSRSPSRMARCSSRTGPDSESTSTRTRSATT